jgi:anti-anti-sigma factor
VRQLDFIDSSGLRCLLDLDSEAGLDGFSLALILGSHPVQRVFELSGTATALPFVDA